MIPYLLSLKPALCGLFHICVKLGVMVNAVNRIVASPFRGRLLVETMGFEPTTIRLEVRCSTVKAISPFGPNKVGTVFDLTSLHYFCEVFYVVIGGG